MTAATAKTWRVTIPGWRPALLNELMGHPLQAARRKARDARIVAGACHLAGVPPVAVPRAERRRRAALGLAGPLPGDPAPRRRSVALAIATPRGRIDPDAPLKSTLDGLVSAGLLVDDSARWCAWSVPALSRGPLATTLTLADLD
jgi:hypothetical protein